MLYPQINCCRTVLDLSGFWEIKIDSDNAGLKKGWSNGFDADAKIGVPGSWNEQLSEIGLMSYVGKIWYQYRLYIPTILAENRYLLRFGSVDFEAKVWINGELAGSHKGGYLPFELDITELIKMQQENLIIISVDNTLDYETIPQGINAEDYFISKREREQNYPITVFDFYAYGGINRPVKLVSVNNYYLKEIKTESKISGETGILKVKTKFNQKLNMAKVEIILKNNGIEINRYEEKLSQNEISCSLEISDCIFWSNENPHLYQLYFSLKDNENLLDEYTLDIGIREINVDGNNLLLNGKPIFLKGFGKHEDFPILGKGLSYPLIVKDFQLIKWLGANSFRTSHYPYAEEVMQMADQEGILVIDEIPAVSLNFKYITDKTFENHKKAISELISRDRNHPSVISWCIANEPGIWGEEEAISKMADTYWSKLTNHTKSLDNSRPITIPVCSKWGEKDLALKYSDFIAMNRYWGWYEIPGDIDRAGQFLKQELDKIYKIYKKPILVSEFGADAIEGEHATYPQMFSEEYQEMLICKYFEIIESLPFTVGEHIWNFADFRTAQHHRRVILNKKGIFNRQRQPKAAAFTIKKHWTSK